LKFAIDIDQHFPQYGGLTNLWRYAIEEMSQQKFGTQYPGRNAQFGEAPGIMAQDHARMPWKTWLLVKDYVDANIDEAYTEGNGAEYAGWHSELATTALSIVGNDIGKYGGQWYSEGDLTQTWHYIGDEAVKKWGKGAGVNMPYGEVRFPPARPYRDAIPTDGPNSTTESAYSGRDANDVQAMLPQISAYIDQHISEYARANPGWHFSFAEDMMSDLEIHSWDRGQVWGIVREEAQRRGLWPWDNSQSGNQALASYGGGHYDNVGDPTMPTRQVALRRAYGGSFAGYLGDQAEWGNPPSFALKGKAKAIGDWIDAHLKEYASPKDGWHATMADAAHSLFGFDRQDFTYVWLYITDHAQALYGTEYPGRAAPFMGVRSFADAHEETDVKDWIDAHLDDYAHSSGYEDWHVVLGTDALRALSVPVTAANLKAAWQMAIECASTHSIGYDAAPEDIAGAYDGYLLKVSKKYRSPFSGRRTWVLEAGQIQQAKDYVQSHIQAWAAANPDRIEDRGWHSAYALVVCTALGFPPDAVNEVYYMVHDAAEQFKLPPYDLPGSTSWIDRSMMKANGGTYPTFRTAPILGMRYGLHKDDPMYPKVQEWIDAHIDAVDKTDMGWHGALATQCSQAL
jgi:hypothetical protein